MAAAEPLEIRMARLEGAYEQINERLFELRSDLQTGLTSVRSEIRTEIAELRRQMQTQFFWLLTFVLGSILIPIVRDLAQ